MHEALVAAIPGDIPFGSQQDGHVLLIEDLQASLMRSC
jgi:hypothetical protein